MLGKSVISSANNPQNEDEEVDMKIDWPEDSILKAKIIRAKAQSMAEDLEAVSNSFVTGKHHAYCLNLSCAFSMFCELLLYGICTILWLEIGSCIFLPMEMVEKMNEFSHNNLIL